MGSDTWRDRMMPLVAQAIESGRAAGLEGAALARYCYRSCPWGGMGHWIRRTWTSEVTRQLRIRRKRRGGESMPLFDRED